MGDGAEILGSRSARTGRSEPFAPSALGGTALRKPKALSSQCAGAAGAALTATRTSTHENDLCDLNFRKDRPLRRMCKEQNEVCRYAERQPTAAALALATSAMTSSATLRGTGS